MPQGEVCLANRYAGCLDVPHGEERDDHDGLDPCDDGLCEIRQGIAPLMEVEALWMEQCLVVVSPFQSGAKRRQRTLRKSKQQVREGLKIKVRAYSKSSWGNSDVTKGSTIE